MRPPKSLAEEIDEIAKGEVDEDMQAHGAVCEQLLLTVAIDGVELFCKSGDIDHALMVSDGFCGS